MTATIVFINGPPGSGKDTLANHLRQTYANVVKTKFATPLKVGVHTLFGLDDVHEDVYENEKMIETLDFFNLTPREAYIKISETFMKPNFGDDVFGYIWLRRNRAYVENSNLVVVSDCGFDRELHPILRHYPESNMCLIRLHRADCDYKKDSRGYVYDALMREADLNNIEDLPQNMFSDFIKVMTRWGFSDSLKLRTSLLNMDTDTTE